MRRLRSTIWRFSREKYDAYLPANNVADTLFGRSTQAYPSCEIQLGAKFIF